MRHTITITILLLHFMGFSQDWLHDKEELKGNVKSVHCRSTMYITEDPQDWWILDYFDYYNTNGFLIAYDRIQKTLDTNQRSISRIFDATGTHCLVEFKFQGDDSDSTNFKYDSLHRVTKSIYERSDFKNTHYYKYNNDGTLFKEYSIVRGGDTISTIYDYDGAGRKVMQTDTSRSCVIVKFWKYDTHGNVLQERSDLRKAPKTIVYTMKEDGTREKEVLETNPDDQRDYLIDYQYDEMGQVRHEIRKYGDGRIQYDVTYEYNEHGDAISENYLDLDDPNGNRIKANIQYEYDDHGNWILKRSYYDGILDQKENRTIVYYE